MQGSARAERVFGNGNPITGEEWKALKGETHERWTLKEASKVRRADAAERVAKPWERNFWVSRAKPPGRSVERLSEEKGFFVPKTL
jgi:hypothetical protein